MPALVVEIDGICDETGGKSDASDGEDPQHSAHRREEEREEKILMTNNPGRSTRQQFSISSVTKKIE